MARIKTTIRGQTEVLQRVFGKSRQSISGALNFKRHTMTDRQIRHYAVNKLGYFII